MAQTGYHNLKHDPSLALEWMNEKTSLSLAQDQKQKTSLKVWVKPRTSENTSVKVWAKPRTSNTSVKVWGKPRISILLV